MQIPWFVRTAASPGLTAHCLYLQGVALCRLAVQPAGRELHADPDLRQRRGRGGARRHQGLWRQLRSVRQHVPHGGFKEQEGQEGLPVHCMPSLVLASLSRPCHLLPVIVFHINLPAIVTGVGSHSSVPRLHYLPPTHTTSCTNAARVFRTGF